ncbi:MAG: polysaccharide biosynthesis tyrosine autokinase [Planctomycetota bacterium]|nr:MAG: polysaccharide biosynthesis tyrosine autokinase [Planctomycetota bacterium]
MAEERQISPSRIPRPSGAGPAVAAAPLSPKEVFAMLRRHVWLTISMTVLGFVAGGAAWYLLLMYFPQYNARTFIRVLPPVEKDPMTIPSAQVQKDIQYGYRVSMANLITQQSTLQRLIDRDKIQQTEWFKGFGKIRDKRIQKAFKTLRRKFGASAQRDGEFIVLSMTCSDRIEAALIVNEMVDLFLASQGATKKEEIARKLAGLIEQQDSLQRDLDRAEAALADVRAATGLTDLERPTGRYLRHTIELRLDDLELEQNTMTLELRQVEADIKNLEELATGPINEQIAHQIETDPVMVVLAQRLAFLESELAGVLTKFGENHRVVRQTQELVEEIRQERALRKAEIAEQTRQSNLKDGQNRLVVLQERYVELEKLRQEVEAKKRDLDLARVQYEQRTAIRDERKEMLDEVKGQIEKLKIMHDDPETPKVQFVGYAPEPLGVSSPRWEFYFPGGTVLGLLSGIGLAFLIELLNDLVRTPGDVARFLRIRLLAVVPDAAEDAQVRGIDHCWIVRKAPYSVISESYRRLRTNLKLSDSGESLKTLLVSSGSGGDGKTSVAVNLATTFVAEDKRVLLIDTNFWRPRLHSIFSRPQVEQEADEGSEFGLSTLLTGLCGYREIIRPSGIEGFDVIDSGPLPPNPAELLGGPQMKQLVKHQREIYDYVVIDGPPLLLVSAAKILAKLVDGTVLVFNAGSTRRGAAVRTIRDLRDVNAEIAGCVLFAVKAMKGGYFTAEFRSYQEYQKLQLAHSI